MRRKYFSSIQAAMFLAFVLTGIPFNSCGQGKDAEKLVHVIFRYDDYSANSVTGAELKIIEAFRKHAMPITFGVIPFKVSGDVEDPTPRDLLPLDAAKGEILKAGFEDGIIDISMHGYSHQTNTSAYLSEFAKLDYKDQVERLSKGREYLQNITGAPVKTFLPPWNTYDLNTLSALEETGFSILSANKKGLAVEGINLQYLPVSCDLRELKDAVRAARRSTDDQPLVVALLHDYDFLDYNDITGVLTFREFFDLMDWVSTQEDVRVISISQAGEIIKDLSAERAIRTKRIYYPEKLPPLSLGSSMLIYQESPSFAMALLKMAAFYSVFIIMGVWLLRWIWKKLISRPNL